MNIALCFLCCVVWSILIMFSCVNYCMSAWLLLTMWNTGRMQDLNSLWWFLAFLIIRNSFQIKTSFLNSWTCSLFLRLLIEDVYLGGAAVCIQHCGCLCIMFKVDMYSQRMHRKKSTYVFMYSVYMSVFRDVLLAGTALPVCSQIHLTRPLFHFYRDSQKPSASVVQNKLSND